jgi:MFS superfamily sulfate permease-like transporter
LRHDLIAALTLVALALPEQLATARLAELPAAQGIAVFAAASVVMVLVSRDRALSVGADSSIAPVIAAALAASAVPGSAALIAAMVGVILCAIGLFRLDGIARLLSLPVAAGMMAGIAIHILVGRLPTALGLQVIPESPLTTLAGVWNAAGTIRMEPLAMTVLVAAVCIAGRGWHPRFPAALVAMVLAVAVAALIDPAQTMLPRAATDVRDWGLVPPVPDPDTALSLLPASLVIALLCLFQTSVVLSETGSNRGSDRRNAIGAVGLANLAVSAIGGFAVNTSPPRTAILRDAGASSQLAGLGAAGIALAVLMLVPGLVQLLPAAALAGVLIFVAIHIFPLGTITQLFRHSPSEATIAFATTALVTSLPLQSGLPLAILLSLLHATLPLFATQVVKLTQVTGTTIWWHRPDMDDAPDAEGLLVLGLTAPMNFVTAEGIVADIHDVVANAPAQPALLVLECAGLLSIDLTGARALSTLIEEYRREGTAVALARVESDRARAQLARSGVLDTLGHDHIFPSVADAVRALAPATAR